MEYPTIRKTPAVRRIPIPAAATAIVTVSQMMRKSPAVRTTPISAAAWIATTATPARTTPATRPPAYACIRKSAIPMTSTVTVSRTIRIQMTTTTGYPTIRRIPAARKTQIFVAA